jgi:hypothetical protein
LSATTAHAPESSFSTNGRETTLPSPTSKSSGSFLKSEIEKFEKKDHEEGLKNGSIPDLKEIDVRLLLEEIEFFVKKRNELVEAKESLALERNSLEQTKSDPHRLQTVKTEISANDLSVRFFNRQISVALHDYRIREDKLKKACYFLQEKELTNEGLQELLKAHNSKRTQKVIS